MKNEKPDNPKAFACASVNGHQAGMTLRDYFAAKAMQGLLGNLAIADKELAVKQREYWQEVYGDITEAEAVCKESFLIADEMLKARE